MFVCNFFPKSLLSKFKHWDLHIDEEEEERDEGKSLPSNIGSSHRGDEKKRVEKRD